MVKSDSFEIKEASYVVWRGREAVLDVLMRTLEGTGPRLLYLWGPPGSGKTWSLRYLAKRVEGETVKQVWTTAEATSPPWLGQLADQIGLPLDNMDVESERLLDYLAQWQGDSRFYWFFDDVDNALAHRDALGQIFLDIANRQGRIIATGRLSPMQLWAGRAYIRHQFHTVFLSDFDADTARRWLQELGVGEDRAADTAIQLANGRPQVLAAMADVLCGRVGFRVSDSIYRGEGRDTAGFLIEQLLHPGSRREAWRGGPTSEILDHLVAAAALVPVFNRLFMRRIVGPGMVEQGWERLVDLPILHHYHGGYYGLFPGLRREIARQVFEAQPWTWEQWTRRAATYYLELLIQGSLTRDRAWDALAAFVRPKLGWSPFFSEGTGVWHVEDPIAVEPDAGSRLRIMGSDGRIQAEADYGWNRRHELVIWGLRWAAPEALPALVAAFARIFFQCASVAWILPTTINPAPLTTLLEWLNFAPSGAGASKWILDFRETAYEEWLASITAPPRSIAPPHPGETVQKVLAQLREGILQEDEDVQKFWRSMASSGTFRAWFLDALHHADLGPRIEGKTILILYYLERRGPHDDLAALLHLSRATYFRSYRDALDRLSVAVFGMAEAVSRSAHASW
ncbi:MAG: AAA family ATPase [Firmicutes bacterium]|nr:AAA family ATPase [Bacillota bacterium]